MKLIEKLSQLVERIFSPNIKILMKAGLIDKEGNPSSELIEYCQALFIEDHLEKVVQHARDILEEQKKEKKTVKKK